MSTPPTRGPSTGRLVLSLLAVLLPLAVGGGVWSWQHDRHDRAVSARDEDRAAVRAATRLVSRWATVDYRELDGYFEGVLAGATGQFKDEFDQTQQVIRDGLTSEESVQVPTIPKGGAGLLERDGDRARVVVTIDAVVTNKSTETPQPRQYRMVVTLQKVRGAWLTSKLEVVT